MRALLDTNVLARPAHNSAGPAAEVLDRLCRSPHVLIVSSFLLAELRRVLQYPRLRRLHGLNDEQIETYAVSVEAAAVLVDPAPDQIYQLVPDDPDDDHVVAAGIAGGIDVLCTRDSHLHKQPVRDYCAEHNIRILTDIELLDELRQSAD